MRTTSPDPAAGPARSRGMRLLWLIACAAAGFAVGACGVFLTAEHAWWLAVPAAVAIGWLFLADPSQCVAGAAPPDERRPDR